ncbi:hypothetical protein [Streptomyces sp. NPDC058595]|uniref:hypothetical protein n=1 Tax=Streptomyces sp. NPDC058595 TaxID=3346550 RepID=UPI00366603A4
MIRLPGAVLRGALLSGAALLGALLVTGCDIQSTDAIDAGDPATIQVFPGAGGDRALIFFRSEGALMPVARPVPYEEFVDPSAPEPPVIDPSTGIKSLSALFAGPLPDERAAGLTDGLPELLDNGLQVDGSEGAQTVVTLPVALSRLDDLAIRQVICTVAFARDAEGRGPVLLRGTDGALEAAVCDADIDMTDLPRPRTAPDTDSG